MKQYSSNVILKPYDLKERVKYFLDHPMFSWDTETMGGEHRGDHVVNNIVWNSFSTEGNTFVLPIGHPNGNRLLQRERRRLDKSTKKYVITPPRYDAPPTQIRPGEAFEILHPLLYNPDIAKTG